MKKKLVSALALMMSCVMLAACGGNKVEENTATPQTETSEAVTESTEEAASTETEAAGELTDVNVAALKGLDDPTLPEHINPPCLRDICQTM